MLNPKLFVRNLNSEFQLLRSNAIQRKKFQNDKFHKLGDDGEDYADDKVRLLRDEEEHFPHQGSTSGSRLEPQFVFQFEGLSMQMIDVEEKVDRLEKLYRSHTNHKPMFQDDNRQEEEINLLSKEVSRGMARCHQQIMTFKGKVERTTFGLESVITKNIVVALCNKLQDVSEKFRKSQNDFLKHLEDREAKSKMYFEDFEEVCIQDDFVNSFPMNRKMNTQELLQLEENTKHVEEREQEIQHIVKSISDLNTVFKDLAQMVSEQGTLVDRIDHNVENTQIKVEQGLKELKKAETYQSKNRKMKCIVILAVILVFLLFILLIKVS